ncbi:MAG: permease, partial [Crocinitomix sp.]|nr:permease [Crocinitomix sp.]
MNYVVNFLEAIWGIFLEMSPYLLLGFLIAGILNVVVTKKLVTRYLGKRGIWSSVKAAILGVPLPLCSCGVIPTG